jgi:hypothetical protein
MKKDTILCMCSPDIDRLAARRAINSVKATDLSRAELIVIDNACDSTFNHSVVMNDMVRHAERTGRNLVILDDDVEIHRYDWLDRLYAAGDDLDADIVGCVLTHDNGHANHYGEFVDDDGLTQSIFEFQHDPRYVVNRATYVPTLCSAVLLIRECHRYHVDVGYQKYKQDLDLCMQAWQQGRRVAIALDLRLMHIRGMIGDRSPNYARIFSEDSARFAQKWAGFVADLHTRPGLAQYRKGRTPAPWQDLLVRAARYRYFDIDAARAIYERVVAECFDPPLVATAHFHLYGLTDNVDHLVRCNQINPCHQAARQKLEAAALVPSRHCDHNLDCRGCHLR